MKTERIDGTDYEVGTPEHSAAKRAQKMRLDAAYLEAHRPIFEHNCDELRAMRNLDARIRNDANAVAFLARDLVFVRQQIERTIYDRLRAAEFVPVESGHPRGAQSYSTRTWDERGEAKVTHDLAGDAPRADVSQSEDLKKYANVRGSYAYSVQDMEYAAFAGVPLDREKALACARMIARGLDKIGRSGDAGVGLTGFLNNANVTVHTQTNGEHLTATADEILADWAELEQVIIDAVRDNLPAGVKPYKLLVASAYEGRYSTLKTASTSDLTVKDYFLRSSRIIGAIERYYPLGELVSPDVAASDAPMSVLYPRDPAVLIWPVPIMYEEQAPEVRGFEWLIQARARAGGVDVRQPKMMLYVQNND